MLSNVKIPYTSDDSIPDDSSDDSSPTSPLAPQEYHTPAMDALLAKDDDNDPPELLARPAPVSAMDKLLHRDLVSDAENQLKLYRSDTHKYYKSPEQLQQLNAIAQNGKGFLERAGDKVSGALSGIINDRAKAGQASIDALKSGNVGSVVSSLAPSASGIWDGIKTAGNTFIDHQKQVGRESLDALTHGGDLMAAEQGNPLPLAGTIGKAAISPFVSAFAGGTAGATQMAPLAVDLVNTGVQASPIMQAAEYLDPKGAQNAEAWLNTGSDMAHGFANRSVSALDNALKPLGNDPEGIPHFMGEQAAMIAAGGPEGMSIAGEAPKAADAIVNGIQQYGNKAAGALATGAAKATPLVVAAGTAAMLPHSSPMMMLYEFGGALLAGEKLSGVKGVINKFIQTPLRDFAADAQMIAEHSDLPRVEAIQAGLRERAQVETAEAQSIFKHLNEKDVDLLSEGHPNGVDPLHGSDSDVLSPDAKKFRARQERAKALNDRADALQSAAATSRVFKDAGKLATSLGITTGEGAVIGGGIAGMSSPVGESDTIPGGALTGAGFGLLGGAASYKSGYNAVKRQDLIKKGKSALSDGDPFYQQHSEAMATLPQTSQDYVNSYSGLMSGSGQKIVVLTPDEFVNKIGLGDGNSSKAPNGEYDPRTGTAFINSKALESGVVPHEVTHAIDQAMNASMGEYRSKLNDLLQSSDPGVRAQVDSAIADYEGKARTTEEPRLRNKLAELLDSYNGDKRAAVAEFRRRAKEGYYKLSPQTLREETTAALGADLFQKYSPEQLYGGKSAGQIIKEWAKGLLGKTGEEGGTTQQFGFAKSPEMAAALRDVMFQYGEQAKNPAKPSLQDSALLLPKPNKNVTTGSAEKPEAIIAPMPHVYADAEKVLATMGVEDPAPKVKAAYDELMQENGGQVPSPEDVALRARKKALMPSDAQMMPQSAAPIDGPAIEADGMIFKGDSHFAARKAALDYGIDPRKVSQAKELFTTRSGETLSPTEARERGESTGQLPKSLKDALTPEDLAKERKFMPAFTHYSNKEGLSKASLGDKEGAMEEGLAPWETGFHKLLKKEDKVGYDGLSPEEQKLSEEYHKKAEQQSGSFDNWYKESGGRQKNAENLFDDVKHMPAEEEGKKLGLAYIGKSEGKGYELHQFNDPETGSTISVKSTAPEGALADKLADTRTRFAGSQYMPADAPERIPFKRFYGKKNGDIIDRLTGKKIDNVDEEDMDTMGDMIDEMNKEEPPLPPNWTGSHPDAFIPSLVGQRKDGTWGIYGPGKDLPLQGDFKSQEEALDALRDVHKQIYAPSVAKLPQGSLSHLALPE